MTTCLQLLSIKMQFWVSAPFLLEDCSPALTKRVSTSDKTQSALKTSFSLITSSLPIYHYRYRASRMGANWQHINMTTNTREKIRTRRRRRKRPTDRPRTLFRECEVFSNTSHVSHFREYKLSWYYYQISVRYLSRYRKQRLWQAINKFFVICYQPL